MDVYLEIGTKRTFAGAIEWPGWCRSGREDAPALQALYEYGPRYAQVLHRGGILFQASEDVSDLIVVERLEGNTTTDFGAPALPPSIDMQPIDSAGFERFQVLLRACWQAFDAALQAAAGKELRKGPRGGGREIDGILQHVVGADKGYLAAVGRKVDKAQDDDIREQINHTRQAVIDVLASANHGEAPTRGPRGGLLWTPRYFVRRLAWHALDHTWEIEDRIIDDPG